MADAASADASTAVPANWVDIKLLGISGLPPAWTTDSGGAPLFSDHVFRYEVDATIGGVTKTFKNGRVLQPLPLYADFVSEARLPVIVVGDGDTATETPEVPADITGAAAAPAGVLGGGPAGDATSLPTTPPSQAEATTPQILWVLGTEVDALEVKEDPAAKKDPKAAAKKGAPAALAATVVPAATEAAKPSQPNRDAPPPCCLRFPLTLAMLAALEDQVEKSLPLTLQFRRVLRPNCPPDWEDAQEQRYTATLPVSLKGLTEPGSTAVVVDAPLVPSAAEPPKEDEKAKKKAAPKKSKGTIPAALQEEVDPNEPHPFVAAKTFARVALTCAQAVTRLPQSRPRPDMQPSDMIPKRVRPPRRPLEATKQYTRDVDAIARRVVADYRAHSVQFKAAQTRANPAATNGGAAATSEEQRQAFLSHLQATGQTHAYKEMLVPCVQAIVKEKFMRRPNATREEIDRVANELYTYLVDHMHLALARCFTGESSAPPAAIDGDAAARWKRMAVEAEVMREYAVAAKYHQERLVQTRPTDNGASGGGGANGGGSELPDVWSEYAEFCLRMRDVLKAEQAYREALALDFTHLPSLVGYGLLLLARGRFSESAVFLQSAVDTAGTSVTWGCLALYYDALLQQTTGSSADDDNKRTTCKRESKYAGTQAVRTNESPQCTLEDVYLLLSTHAMHLHHEELATLCLARATPGPAVAMQYARLFHQTGQNEEAVQSLKEVLEARPQDAPARLLLGDVYAAMGRPTDAEAAYDAALRVDPQCGTGPAYVRLGNMYAALGKFKDALGAFLLGAKVWPCGLTWLGVGIAYFRLDDLARAEQALNESNVLNNLNPKTWAYLALACLRQRREDEGDQSFNQAIKQGLADPFLIAEVGAEQVRLGRHGIAEACFRRALALKDDCNTRMYLARTLAAMRRLPEAKEQFLHVATHSTNETQRLKAEEHVARIPAEAA